MAVSGEFLDFACELFSGLGPVRFRRMFGGAGLYASEVMFALVADDVIYLKGDDALAGELEAQGCLPFMFIPKTGEPQPMRYWRLPEEALDDEETALAWGRRALDVALGAKREKGARGMS
ncbi:MAG: TfoX/Sxy family protein [Oceanicaulis sp.]